MRSNVSRQERIPRQLAKTPRSSHSPRRADQQIEEVHVFLVRCSLQGCVHGPSDWVGDALRIRVARRERKLAVGGRTAADASGARIVAMLRHDLPNVRSLTPGDREALHRIFGSSPGGSL